MLTLYLQNIKFHNVKEKRIRTKPSLRISSLIPYIPPTHPHTQTPRMDKTQSHLKKHPDFSIHLVNAANVGPEPGEVPYPGSHAYPANSDRLYAKHSQSRDHQGETAPATHRPWTHRRRGFREERIAFMLWLIIDICHDDDAWGWLLGRKRMTDSKAVSWLQTLVVVIGGKDRVSTIENYSTFFHIILNSDIKWRTW